MSNDDNKMPITGYSEIVFTNTGSNKILEKHKSSSITWYEETKTFSSMYEAQEYVSSEIYPEILHNYTGYKTKDPKLAYSLLFDLVVLKTQGNMTKNIYANLEADEGKLLYLVWISSE